MTSTGVLGILLFSGLLLGIAASNIQDEKTAPLTYEKSIEPILQKNCMPCHSEEEENESELYFDTLDNLMKGGKHGSPVVAGDPDKSNLYRKLLPDPPFGKQMPPRRRKLSPEDIATIKTWIEQGAARESSAGDSK